MAKNINTTRAVVRHSGGSQNRPSGASRIRKKRSNPGSPAKGVVCSNCVSCQECFILMTN